jgi:uncharacterized membrane protein
MRALMSLNRRMLSLGGRKWLWLLLIGCLVAGSINFARDAARQSLFVDDAYSWYAAQMHGAALMEQVRNVEVAPPTYYALLHVWMYDFAGQSEAGLRAISIVTGVLLVIATALLGATLGGRRAAVAAAVLTALSPLVLQYSQYVRAYIFSALACTLALAAVVRAGREGSRRWCAAAAAAAIVAIWFDYTAALVLFPALGWLALQAAVSRGHRVATVLIVVAAVSPLIPLAAHQIGLNHAGVAAFATFTPMNLAAVIAGPFSGRYTAIWPRYAGAALMCAAFASFMWHSSIPWKTRQVVLAVSLLPVLAVVGITLLWEPVLIVRYIVVAVPGHDRGSCSGGNSRPSCLGGPWDCRLGSCLRRHIPVTPEFELSGPDAARHRLYPRSCPTDRSACRHHGPWPGHRCLLLPHSRQQEESGHHRHKPD